MPNPIGGVNASDPVGAAGAAGQAASSQGLPGGQPAAANPAPAQDSADVGGTQQLLATIANAAAAVPGTDEARIGELQKAIADGTYQVDPQQIAQNLLGLDAALSDAGK